MCVCVSRALTSVKGSVLLLGEMNFTVSKARAISSVGSMDGRRKRADLNRGGRIARSGQVSNNTGEGLWGGQEER